MDDFDRLREMTFKDPDDTSHYEMTAYGIRSIFPDLDLKIRFIKACIDYVEGDE